MKKLNLYLSAFAIALLMIGFAPMANAQVVEDDWMYNVWKLDELPASLQRAETPAITVAPNPTIGESLTVFYNRVTQASEIMVFNTLGNLIFAAQVGDAREAHGARQFNTSNLAAGLYIVKLKSGLYESIEKVLIQR